MKKLLITLVIIISIILFALFSDRANDELKPYIAKFIESKIADTRLSVEIEEYRLDSDHITLCTKINQKSSVKIYGDLDLLSQQFNLHYTIDSTKQPLNLKGIARGSIDNISVKGAGVALSSQLTYKLELRNQKPQNIQVDIKQAKVEEILRLMGEPLYAKGLFDLHIDMPKIEKNGGKGNAKIILHKTLLDSKVIMREQGVRLPPKTTLHGRIISQLKGVEASIDGDIKSNLANIILKNGKFNIETNAFFSEYILDIKELKDLKSITQNRLRGALQLTGEVKQNKKLDITGVTDSFGGKIDFTIVEDKLRANIKKVSVKKLLYKLQYPLIFSAPLSGELDYNLKLKKGQLTTQLPNAKLLKNQLTDLVKQLLGIDLTDEVYNHTSFDAKIVGDMLDFKLLAKSRRYQISVYKAKLNQKSNRIDAKYRVTVDKKDIGGKIKGNVNSPRVTIDSSKFLKRKVKNIVEDYIDQDDKERIKKRLKDFGFDKDQGNEAIDKAKNFLKDFF